MHVGCRLPAPLCVTVALYSLSVHSFVTFLFLISEIWSWSWHDAFLYFILQCRHVQSKSLVLSSNVFAIKLVARAGRAVMYVESKPDSSKGKLHAFYFKDEASAQMVADNVAQVLCGRVQYSMYTAPLCKGLIAVALYQVSLPPLNCIDGHAACLSYL